MNIQQALNQSLISGATSAYLTGDILERGKQSAIDKYKSSSEELTESKKQSYIVPELVRDEYNELADGNRDIITDDDINDSVKIDGRVVNANAQLDMANKNFQRAEKNLNKWVLDRDELDSLKKIHQTNYGNMEGNLLQDLHKAKVEAKALRSLTQQQETATNTTKELNKRIDGLRSGTYKSRMHQPSVRMEE